MKFRFCLLMAALLICTLTTARAEDAKEKSTTLEASSAPKTEPKAEAKPEAKPATLPPSAEVKEVAVLKTSAGEMVVEFWSDAAPKTVENFKKLAKESFYNGTCFHRIIKGFMAQGGDPLSKDPSKESSWGTGGPGYQIKAEFNEHPHVFGVLSMARSRNPDSAGSQFFICLGEAKHLDRQYTAFGKVIKGEDVLKRIGETPVSANERGEPSKPSVRINLDSVKIVPADSIR